MPATIEGLLILLIFVMPGFITVRTREMFVPSVGKPDALQITLRSVTVSLLYLPLWLLALGDLLVLRARLTKAVDATSLGVAVGDRAVLVFFALALVLPIATGVIWAIAYWNEWYAAFAAFVYPRLGLRPPGKGVGEDLWDKLWLNLDRQLWLTVFMKDGRIYVGRGVEFSQSGLGRDLLLGPDTQMFDKEWNPVRNLKDVGGTGVWIPSAEVSSIDLCDPLPEMGRPPQGPSSTLSGGAAALS